MVHAENNINNLVGIPPNHNYKINKLQDYLDIIEKVENNFDCGFKGESLCFRGITDYTYSMIPSIYRGQLFDKSNKEYYKNEREIFQLFQHEARCYIDGVANDDLLMWLSYAQHFNVPTRLLDFTANPLVALYFACKNCNSQDGAIWIINTKKYREELIDHLKEIIPGFISIEDTIKQLLLNIIEAKLQFVSDLPIPIEPYYIDSRMSAQSSKFFIWGNTPVGFERVFVNSDYINFDNINENAFLIRIIIPSSEKKRLTEQLDKIGVNEKYLFPGLDGVGKYINAHYKIIRELT